MLDTATDLAALAGTVDRFCRALEADDAEPVVVLRLPHVDLTSTQRAWPPRHTTTSDVSKWEKAVRRLESLQLVKLAVGSGRCGGPATDLLLVADYRLAADDFVLLFPVNDGHFFPSMTLYRLAQELPGGHARQLVLWASDMAAARAHELGLIDRVVPLADVRAAEVSCEQLLEMQGAAAELRLRRQLLSGAQQTVHEEALGVHLAACDREFRRWRV